MSGPSNSMASAMRSAQFAERFDVAVVGLGRAIEVGVRHAQPARCQRLERRLEHRNTGDRQRALRRAVIRDGPRNHLVFAGLSRELEVLLGELPGGLHGLTAAGGEKHPVQVAGCVVGDPLGEFDGRRCGVGPQREERQRLGLLGRRLGELLAAVADLDHEQAAQAVDVALALVIPDRDPLATGDDRRRDAFTVLGEMTPQVAVSFGAQALSGYRICFDRCHRTTSLCDMS